jgi:insecticidal toxin complex protein TccC
LQSWTRSIYSDDNNQPLSLGEAGLPLLPYQQQTAFESEENMTLLFVDNLEPDVLNVKLKQGFYRLDPDNNYWWNDGLRAEYNNLDKFYLPSKAISPATDPANALQVTESNTTYRYDAYALILIQTQDDYGNTSIASDIDYQTLQPGKLTDPNSISTEVSYDPLGQVVYTSVYGYENGQEQPVGFKPISEAPVNESATLAQIIGNPEQYLGAMQSYFFYDLFAYCKRQQPVCALSLVAENYAITGQAAGLEKVFAQRQEQDLLRKSGPSQLPMQIQLAYSDGLGRELQSKARVEPGEYLVFQDGVTGVTKAETDHRWLTTGAKVYNNKGDAVKEYEPYFSNTSDYVFDSALNTWGVSSELYYDPIGRLRKTITPKGFVIKQEHTPWETKSWDANDTIVDSHYYKANQSNDPHTDSPYYDKQLSEAERKNLAYVKKYFSGTPTVATMDNMGNVIVQQKTNQSPSNLDSPLSNDSTVIKSTLSDYSFYDVAGRLLKAADPRLSESGIFNFEMAYPMAAQDPITTVGVDAGSSWLLANSLGNPIYSCDARGTVISTNYDLLQRPIKIHAKKDSSTADVLVINQVVQQIIYGDTPNSGAPKYYNLRGQVVQNFESSGLSKTSSYALGGQPMASDQRFFSDYKTQGNWDDISQAAQQQLLQSSHYTNSASYDALGRVTAETDSDGNVISPQYHSSGLLNTLQLKAADDNSVSAYVDGISYDAKGQRQQVQYGNGTVTNYQYDPKTFAPIKITTSNNAGQAIQDIGYQYDPVGNVFQKNIFSEDSVCYANQQVLPISTYLYDALYQLIQGKGREKMGGGSSDSGDCSIDLSRPAQNDHQALQNYTEKYNYDTGSNLIKTQHTAGNTSWTREMVVSGSSNRSVINNIQGKDNPPTTEQVDQFFDPHGNQIKLQAIHPLQWDYANQLQQVTTIARDDGVNDAEYYVYNSSGQRLRKVQESYGSNGAICTINQTLYLGNLEIRQTLQGTDLDSAKVTKVTKEYHSLRLMDGDHGVATRTFWVHGEPPTGFEIPNMTYHLQDNLGSYSTQVNAAGEVIAREEYSPFGCSTLFIGSGAANELSHYRYSGKERDSVTGFYYYGFRYYATWLGRWLNPDPAGTVDGLNVYAFVGNNPVTFNDPDGNFRQHLARTGKWLKETARSVMNSAGKGISEAACKGFEVTRGLEDTLGAGLNAIAIFAIAGSLGGTAAGVAAAIVAFTLCGFLSMDQGAHQFYYLLL